MKSCQSGKKKNKKRYICDQCNREFKRKYNLDIHRVVHTKERPYTCDICKSTFSQRSGLKSHILIHSDARTFVCKICNLGFKQSSTLRSHLPTHGPKTFKCDTCDKRFSRKILLRQHLRLHNKTSCFTCEECNTKFTRKCNLARHILNHCKKKFIPVDAKPFKCEFCEKRFARKFYFKLHVRSHIEKWTYDCEFCKTQFTFQENLRKHKCKYCESRCFKESDLNKNHLIQSDRKTAISEESGEECFQDWNDKLIHVHKKSAIYEKSGLKFSDLALNVSRYDNTDKKLFICKICCKGFLQQSILTEHLQIHTNRENLLLVKSVIKNILGDLS